MFKPATGGSFGGVKLTATAFGQKPEPPKPAEEPKKEAPAETKPATSLFGAKPVVPSGNLFGNFNSIAKPAE